MMLVGAQNQSIAGPRSKSSVDNGPSVRIRSSTSSATFAFSASIRGAMTLQRMRNHGSSGVGRRQRLLLYASNSSRTP